MNKTNLYRFALVCAVLLTSCVNPLERPGNLETADGYGKISISFSTGESRTIFPSKVFQNYVYTFTKSGSGDPQVIAPDNGTFTLEAGNWYVQVDAYAGDVVPENLAASGSSEFWLSSNDIVTISITLTATETEGDGLFRYRVQYPAGTSVDMALQKLPEMTGLTLSPLTDDTSVTETIDALPAGFYLLNIRLTKDGKYAGVSEVVHIYPLMTTEYGTAEAPIIFDEAHFTTFDTADPNDPLGPVDLLPTKYAKDLRGEWIRMDTGERWYISGNAITVNGNSLWNTVTLSKTGQIITVKEAGRSDYFLFASRQTGASFSAQVVVIAEEPEESGNAGRSAIRSAVSMPPVKVINPRQPEMAPIIIEPDPLTGFITVPNQIPGDPLQLVPWNSEWEDVTVTLPSNWDDGMDMGIVPLVRGSNLKASIRMDNTMYNTTEDITNLFADGIPRYYVIGIENIGTNNCTRVTYEVSCDSGDFTVGSGSTLTGNLDTIRPGAENRKDEIKLTLGSLPFADGLSKNKAIKIKLRYFDDPTNSYRTCEDTVSLTFHKSWVPFRFKSRRPVQGVLKAAEGKTFYFNTSGYYGTDSDGYYSTSVNVPWATEDYILAFLGATVEANSETHYSFAIDEQPPTNRFNDYDDDLFAYKVKDNPTEANAYPIDMTSATKSFTGYLEDGDIDYFRVNMGAEPYEPNVIIMENWEIRDTGYWYDNVSSTYYQAVYQDNKANPGETIALDVIFKNNSEEHRNLTMTGLSVDSDHTQYVEHILVPRFYDSNYYPYHVSLPSYYYGSITGYPWENNKQNLDDVTLFTNSGNTTPFMFTLTNDCPAGPMTITLSFKDHLYMEYTETITLNVAKAPATGIQVNPPPLIIEETIEDFPEETFTLSRGTSQQIILADPDCTDIIWWIDTVNKTSLATNNSRAFEIKADSCTVGTHTLTVIFTKNGKKYSNGIDFTVVQ